MLALEPFWTTTDGETVKLYLGDVISVLKQLPEKSVQCVVTSPPYWGLRSYLDSDHDDKHYEIGTEETPEEYVTKMTDVFREVRRVLRDDGTVWLNLGDSYCGGGPGGVSYVQDGVKRQDRSQLRVNVKSGLPPGNLVGVPWRVALALRADGWVLRQDIIWHKPSPMPESVTNRCTKAHEYVFLLTKSQRYFYDAESIKEKTIAPGVRVATPYTQGSVGSTSTTAYNDNANDLRNKRSVWTIPSFGYSGAHFATFPPKLIEPMVLAGTSQYGCCAVCLAPWKRVMETKQLTRERPNDYVKRTGEGGTGNSCSNSIAGVETKTVGWEPACQCDTDDVVPCTVLDPFVGSGTTCCVAVSNGRHSIGIDLSEKYLKENAIPRIEGEILRVPARRNLVQRSTKTIEIKEGF